MRATSCQKAPTLDERAHRRSASTSTSAPGTRARSTTTFYDTFDGRLHAAGVTLRHAGGRLTLLDRATGEDARRGARRRAAPRLFDHDLPGALREPARRRDRDARARARGARAHAASSRSPCSTRDEKTVVRLTRRDATSARCAGASRRPPCAATTSDLERVQAVLRDTLSLPEATVPLVDEAIAAAGGAPAGTSAKLDARRSTPDAARERRRRDGLRPPARGHRRQPARARSRTSTPSSCTTCASPSAARARCSASSSRSTPSACEHFRDEFKRLQAITGDLRDLDVYLLDFDDLRAVAARADARRPRPAARRARRPAARGR